MALYIALFVFCVGILLVNKKDKAFLISVLVLWAVFAFRDSVGVDDVSYIRAFESLTKGWAYDIEWSYRVLTMLANRFGLTYKAVFFFYATLSYFLFYRGVNLLFETNKKKALFLACFFGTVFVSAMSVMRQFLSACFCFYSVALLYKENKFLKPLLLCVLATIFHGGAVISIPFLLIIRPQVHITYKMKLIIVSVCVVAGYSNLITRFLNMLMEFLPSSYQIYSDSITGSFSSAGGMLSLLLLLLFVLQTAFSTRSGKTEPADAMQIVMEKGQLVYLGLLFLFVHAGVASRLAFTFLLFSPTIPITFVRRIKGKDRIIISLAFYGLMFLLYIMALRSVSFGRVGAFIPYNASLKFWR